MSPQERVTVTELGADTDAWKLLREQGDTCKDESQKQNKINKQNTVCLHIMCH